MSDRVRVHRVPGTALQPGHSENRQPAKTYLESGVPQKCPTDSYSVRGGVFTLLKIARLSDGKMAFSVIRSLVYYLRLKNDSIPIHSINIPEDFHEI